MQEALTKMEFWARYQPTPTRTQVHQTPRF